MTSTTNINSNPKVDGVVAEEVMVVMVAKEEATAWVVVVVAAAVEVQAASQLHGRACMMMFLSLTCKEVLAVDLNVVEARELLILNTLLPSMLLLDPRTLGSLVRTTEVVVEEATVDSIPIHDSIAAIFVVARISHD